MPSDAVFPGGAFPPAVHHTVRQDGDGTGRQDGDGTVRQDGDGAGGRIELAVHELGPTTATPPVVLCHGFPELAYSWRHQLPALADAGFRAVAPDQRGYGGSSAPGPVDAYGIEQLCGDLVGLLDSLEVERAVFVGHDWGGFVAWAMPLLHPDRCAGVAGVCTPYMGFPTTAVLRSIFGDDDEAMYMLWFQAEGVAEAHLDRRVEAVFRTLMVGGVDPSVAAGAGLDRQGGSFNPFLRVDELDVRGEPVATDEELRHYVEVFSRTGFRGGINWYRNLDANAAALPDLGRRTLDLPALMICAELDPALPPALAAGMPEVCSDLESHTIGGAGHWVQQECPDQVNGLLLDWLTRRFAG